MIRTEPYALWCGISLTPRRVCRTSTFLSLYYVLFLGIDCRLLIQRSIINRLNKQYSHSKLSLQNTIVKAFRYIAFPHHIIRNYLKFQYPESVS